MAKSNTQKTPNADNDATGNDTASAPRTRTDKSRATAQKAVDRARETATDAVERARAVANDAVDSAAQVIDEAPLTAIAGAIAIGAVAAAMIPATARELQALGPLGDRMRGALDDAFKAAKTAGLEQLTTKGITQTAITGGLGTVVGHFVTAAMEASKAASDSVRRKEQASKSGDASDQPSGTSGDR